jgi:hypothetical protein
MDVALISDAWIRILSLLALDIEVEEKIVPEIKGGEGLGWTHFSVRPASYCRRLTAPERN